MSNHFECSNPRYSSDELHLSAARLCSILNNMCVMHPVYIIYRSCKPGYGINDVHIKNRIINNFDDQ